MHKNEDGQVNLQRLIMPRTMDEFLGNITWLVFNPPDLNTNTTKATVGLVILIFCAITFVILKESAKWYKFLHKYISKYVFHILIGIIIGTIERSLKKYNILEVTPVYLTPYRLANIRVPIMLYASYELYHRYFFRQIPYLLIYGVIGNTFFMVLTGVLIKEIFTQLFKFEIAYHQSMAFVAVTSMTDPLAAINVFKEYDERNFYFILGLYVIGNGITAQVYEATLLLINYPVKFNFPHKTFAAISIKVLIDILFSILIGAFVGVATSILTRFTRRYCEYYELGLIVIGVIFSIIVNSYCGFSVWFGTLTCCIFQERYVFMNISTRSVMAVKVAVEAASYLSNLACYVLVGYKFSDVMFRDVNVVTFASVTIIVTYVVKFLLVSAITLLINLTRKKRPIGIRLQALLVFGGVKGPRTYGSMLNYQNAPFSYLFLDTQVHLIVFSVLVDTLINKVLVRSIKKKIVGLKDKHVTMIPLPSGVEDRIASCMDSLVHLELKIQKLLVTKKEEIEDFSRLKREQDAQHALDELDRKSFDCPNPGPS